ncbi:AgrD family cyclic lactone autoinducer peptide [Massilia sp. TS11]
MTALDKAARSSVSSACSCALDQPASWRLPIALA